MTRSPSSATPSRPVRERRPRARLGDALFKRLCQAAALLKTSGARRIQFICLVACPPGVEQLHSRHPDIDIVTAAIDPELNEFGYIVPGLGDAGDRYFGTA